jgi:hypothetical protein
MTATQFAGTATCVKGIAPIIFATSFKNMPAILVFDEDTKNGTSLQTKSISAFTVSCSRPDDSFSWLAIGNPD